MNTHDASKQALRELQGNRSLPQIALDVHQSLTGSYPRAAPDILNDVKILRMAILLWDPTAKKRSVYRFDEAVRALINAALFEYEEAEYRTMPISAVVQ